VLARLIDKRPDFNPRAWMAEQMPSEREVLQIAERWRPYRSLAVSYLFASEFET
jgi:3-methyladenine DNA glycosylase/8-oxoguanine DNA glycosylase